MTIETLELIRSDPRSPAAAALISALSQELARRYDFTDDGSGLFQPEDAMGPGAGFVIGWIGGRAVACGAFRPLEPGVCEVKRMYVAPDCRGRGYSRAVLVELERLAAADGYTAIRLETGVRQPEAIGLYERAGYARVPNFGPYVGNDQSVCYERQLQDPRAQPEPGSPAGSGL